MSKKSTNIVCFVRGCDPRPYSADADLLGSLEKELELTEKYGFECTILFDYFALVTPEFTEAYKKRSGCAEAGIWFEITKPLIEDAGMVWKWPEPWDWHVYPGFFEAYEPEEREKIIDVAFAKYKEVFGFYPRVVGSWLMDAYSMKYMADNYDMDAFCVCREQFGVDAYTLWGGYFNGAYYASVNNMLIPAQSKEKQINVPVLRMLGMDPADAYDETWRKHTEKSWGARTLEPTWPTAQDEKWVRWYFKNLCENEDLGFSYTQTGQENSFGFEAHYGKGLEMHYKILTELVNEGKVTVEKMSDTGKWFKENYDTTPATVYSNMDFSDENIDCQSVWYSSKKYRANLYNFEGTVKIRDINLFDEDYEEYYLKKAHKGGSGKYYAYPVVDGYLWGSQNDLSGLYFDKKGSVTEMKKFGDTVKSVITFEDGNTADVVFDDYGITVTATSDFVLTLQCDKTRARQLEDIYENTVNYRQDGHVYHMHITEGKLDMSGERPLTVASENGKAALTFSIDK